MDLTNQQIKDTYGNVLTIGTTAGSPTTGTLQNGEGLDITSFTFGSFGSIVGTGGYSLRIYGGGQSWLPNLGIVSNLGFGPAFSSDTILTRDGSSGTLAQRNSTNAQTFNLYNTYTDASNYERGFLKWDTNVLKIGTEALGTGTTRSVQLGSGNNGYITIKDFSDNDGIIFGQGGSPKLILRPTSFRPSSAAGISLGESAIPFQDIFLRPSSSLTPSANGDLVIESTDNTTLTFKYKGSDGVVRSGTVALS